MWNLKLKWNIIHKGKRLLSKFKVWLTLMASHLKAPFSRWAHAYRGCEAPCPHGYLPLIDSFLLMCLWLSWPIKPLLLDLCEGPRRYGNRKWFVNCTSFDNIEYFYSSVWCWWGRGKWKRILAESFKNTVVCKGMQTRSYHQLHCPPHCPEKTEIWALASFSACLIQTGKRYL